MMKKGVAPEDVTEELFARNLQIGDSGDVDLFIRTSSESRISNFLLWELAYSELYFTSVLWPDFGKKEFKEALSKREEYDRLIDKEALLWYASRERRFGKTSEQISEKNANK